jgi:hypothetical protein
MNKLVELKNTIEILKGKDDVEYAVDIVSKEYLELLVANCQEAPTRSKEAEDVYVMKETPTRSKEAEDVHVYAMKELMTIDLQNVNSSIMYTKCSGHHVYMIQTVLKDNDGFVNKTYVFIEFPGYGFYSLKQNVDPLNFIYNFKSLYLSEEAKKAREMEKMMSYEEVIKECGGTHNHKSF